MSASCPVTLAILSEADAGGHQQPQRLTTSWRPACAAVCQLHDGSRGLPVSEGQVGQRTPARARGSQLEGGRCWGRSRAAEGAGGVCGGVGVWWVCSRGAREVPLTRSGELERSRVALAGRVFPAEEPHAQRKQLSSAHGGLWAARGDPGSPPRERPPLAGQCWYSWVTSAQL